MWVYQTPLIFLPENFQLIMKKADGTLPTTSQIALPPKLPHLVALPACRSYPKWESHPTLFRAPRFDSHSEVPMACGTISCVFLDTPTPPSSLPSPPLQSSGCKRPAPSFVTTEGGTASSPSPSLSSPLSSVQPPTCSQNGLVKMLTNQGASLQCQGRPPKTGVSFSQCGALAGSRCPQGQRLSTTGAPLHLGRALWLVLATGGSEK